MDGEQTLSLVQSSPMPRPPKPLLADWAHRGLAVLAVLGATLVILLPPWVAAQDLPGWSAASSVVLHPERFPWLLPNVPLTQLLFNGLLVALGNWLPLAMTLKVALLIGLAGWCSAWCLIARRLGGEPFSAVAVAAASWVGWMFVMGFGGYLFGSVCGAFALAALLRPGETWRSTALAALWVALAIAGHVVAAGHACLFIVAWVSARPCRRRLAQGAAILVPAAIAAAVICLSATENATYTESIAGGVWSWGTPLERLSDALTTTFVGYTDGARPLGVYALILVCVRLFLKEADASRNRFVSISLIGSILLSIVAPHSGLGFIFIRERLLLFPALLALSAIPAAARWKWVQFIAVALATVAACAAVPVAVHEGKRTEANIASFGVEPVGRVYGVLFEPPSTVAAPHARPHLGDPAYALVLGGVSPTMFATNHVWMPATFRIPLGQIFPDTRSWFHVSTPCDPSEKPCLTRLFNEGEKIAVDALAFDTIVAIGMPAPTEFAVRRRGWQQVTAGTWKRNPSRLTLVLPAATEPAPTLAQAEISRVAVAQGRFGRRADGMWVATLENLVAGPVLVGVVTGRASIGSFEIALDPGEQRTIQLGSK